MPELWFYLTHILCIIATTLENQTCWPCQSQPQGFKRKLNKSNSMPFLRDYEFHQNFLHRTVMLIDSLISVTKLIMPKAGFTVLEI